MKNNFLFRCFFVLSFTLQSSVVFCKGTLIEIPQFGINPGNLNLNYYLPKNTNTSSAKKPLLVVLHGCNQTAQSMADLCGWNKLADENNFIVLYPEQKMANNPSRCFNWFLSEDIEKGNGECESIREMIAYLQKREHVDSTRIFIAGLSAGAAMTVVMLATHPDLFKAGTSFAGAAYKTATNGTTALQAMSGRINKPADEWRKLVREQNPEFKGSYPKLITYHGTNDKVVHQANSDNLATQWIMINMPDSSYKAVYINKVTGNKDVSLKVFANDTDSERIEYLFCYTVQNLGHKILIDPGNGPERGGKKGVFSKDIGFHAPYRALVDMGLIPFSE